MCGIAGFTLPRDATVDVKAEAEVHLRRMVTSLRHRGPDALDAVIQAGIALGHARLAILDPAGGAQPMRDDTTGVTVVFNGEIFNHDDLRRSLTANRSFRTRSDTEVILAAFLERGIECVSEFNGQFAFAIFDPRDLTLWLARDRFGKLPLFYSETSERFVFASEAKAILASGLVQPRLDRHAIAETLRLWAPATGRSFFDGIRSLPPGSVARLRDGDLSIHTYWELDLADERIDHGIPFNRAADELEALLYDAVRLRLRADVPVGAYLSGGLDSSLLCAIAQEQLGGGLQTYSVAFSHPRYDERGFQESVARTLGTDHRTTTIENAEVGTLLPAVVEHAESAILRTAPAPLLKLSHAVRVAGTKVVLTGEGADEMFLGYDLFKETKIRQFWARQPESRARGALFGRLYPYLAVSKQSPQLMRQFFGVGLDQPSAADFSHRIRWTNSGRISRFLSRSFVDALDGWDPVTAFLSELPSAITSARPLARAQLLEARTLLSQYLLSTQGDRMLMANSVEGRFPFLDHRIAEFAARLPDWMKLRGLREKLIVRRLAKGRVPPQVATRTKFPYRAPIAEALLGPCAPTWAKVELSRDAIDDVGVFDGTRVEKLIERLASTPAASDADEMALVAVASTQLLARRFLCEREISPLELEKVQVRAA